MEDIANVLQEVIGNPTLSPDEISKLSDICLRKILLLLWKKGIAEFPDKFSFADDLKFLDWLVGKIVNSSCTESARAILFNLINSADRSISLPKLRDIFRAINNQECYFVDGDNFPDIADFLETIADKLSNRVFFAFISAKAKNSSFEKAVRFPWFYYVRAPSEGKDAADHVLTAAATLANELISINTSFFIVSRDGFAPTSAAIMSLLQPRRCCTAMSPKEFREILIGLNKSPEIITSKKSMPVTVCILSYDDRFNAYCFIVHKYIIEHPEDGNQIRLSHLGNMLSEHSITSHKVTTKRLTDRAEDEGLLKREGSLGQAIVVVDVKKLADYVKEHPSNI